MAYIYLKKDDQPIYFSEEKYEVVYKIWEKYKNGGGDGLIRLPNTDIPASDIKRLTRGNEKAEKVALMSAMDVKAFAQEELKPFLTEKGALHLEGELDYLASKNVIRLKKLKPDGEGRTASDFDYAIYEENMSSYFELTEKIGQYQDYRARVEYAKKKELEELSASAGVIAQGMNINDKPNVATPNEQSAGSERSDVPGEPSTVQPVHASDEGGADPRTDADGSSSDIK